LGTLLELLFLSFFFSKLGFFFPNFGFFFKLLRCFGLLLFEKEVYNSGTHDRITENTGCTGFGSTREWRVIFILSSNFVGLALSTLFVCTMNCSCIFKHTYSKLAGVAFKTPLLFRVELHREVAVETFYAKVDEAVITV
jgi:hypothetical protein